MTTLRVHGVHTVHAKGRTYHYHRASGTRIKASPDDPAAFAAEVAALDTLVPRREAPATVVTLGALIAIYKASPEWLALKPDTQRGYQRAFNALQPIDALALADLDQPRVLKARDKVFARHGRWLANMAVSVLSVVLGWGLPRGYVARNAAAGVPKIRRRSGDTPNKAWTWAEVEAMLQHARGGLRKAIALAYFTGLRKKDVVELPRAARRRDGIELASSKPGRTINVFEAKRLSAILDEPDAVSGPTLVVTEQGHPYTRDGLDTLFDRLKRKLVAESKLRPGLTFHGLRKSLGRDAAELGFSENDIAGALGQLNPASARPYTQEARQKQAARRVLKALERRGKR